MARPSSTLRLKDIDPAKFGEDVHNAVLSHIATLALRIDATWRADQGPSTLRWTAQMLAGYARIGLPATDWPDHGCAMDAILDVCSSLYACAGEPSFGAGELDALETETEATTPVGIVLLAAHGRVRISRRERLSRKEVAALGGVDRKHLTFLEKNGELEIDPDKGIRSAEARRWLGARGVEGL